MPSTHELVQGGAEVLLGMLQHRSRQGDADAARLRFRQVMGDDASFSMELPSWHCHLVARDSEIRIDPERRVAVAFHGQLYDPPAEDPAGHVLEAYLERGPRFLEGLNGNYRLFVLDAREDRVFCVTDRVSTRKVFAGGGDGVLWLATLPSLIPGMDSRPLDLAGVADYVTNGVIHNGRTLFEGARALPPAGVHEATPAGWSSRPYWRYELLSPAKADEPALAEELLFLVRQSIERRVRRQPIVISLSGGYDSCAALALLSERIPPERLAGLSYSHGEPPPESDPEVARQVARLYGLPHEIVDSYGGDFWPTLESNVRVAMGYGEFCNEPNFWDHVRVMARQGRCGSLFVADECWGLMDFHLACPTDVLHFMMILPMTALRPLRACVPAPSFRAMQRALSHHHDEILRRAGHLSDLHDKKDWLHFDQRQPYRTLPWRELHLAPLVPVCNPFMDDTIFDFMRKVPRRLRIDKALFVRTMERHHPKAFQVPRAKFHGTHPDWRALFLEHRAELLDRTRGGASRLDELFPPATVGWLLDRLEAWRPPGRNPAWKRLARAGVRTVGSAHPAADRAMRPLLDESVPSLDPMVVLKRLLALRLWLTAEHCRPTPLSPR